MTRNTCPASSKLCDHESRRRKAEKVVTILDDFLGKGRMKTMRCLDVGCYAGLITEHLSLHFQTTVGLDPDTAAITCAQKRNSNERLTFLVGDAAHLPFTTGSFEVLICAQVYEHVTDQDALFRELWRVLKPDGVCFLSGPNRLAWMEEHYGLPGLSWLPRRLADLYVRIAGRGDAYYENPMTYWQLRRHVHRFSIRDYTVEMLKSPEQFSCSEEMSGRIRSLVSSLPRGILRTLNFLLPNYNWVLWKTQNRDSSQESG